MGSRIGKETSVNHTSETILSHVGRMVKYIGVVTKKQNKTT